MMFLSFFLLFYSNPTLLGYLRQEQLRISTSLSEKFNDQFDNDNQQAKRMFAQKSLQNPYQQQNALASEIFLYKGLPTTFSLFPDNFTVVNKDQSHTFPVQLYSNFQILEDIQNPESFLMKISPGDGQIFELFKEQWDYFSRQMWECKMLKVMNRMNFHSFFTPITKLGKGTFAPVYLAESKKVNGKVAVKVFPKSLVARLRHGREGLSNEIKMMRKVANSANIVKIKGVYQTENTLYIIQQFAQGKSLSFILTKNSNIPYHHKKAIIFGLLNALVCLEFLGIVHRDIKPDNIVYDHRSKSLKLVDFGLATEVDLSQHIFNSCGSPGHVAPEIISLKRSCSVKFGTASDVFSAGTIFFHLILGKMLFQGKDTSEILERNRTCDLSQVLTEEMKEFIGDQQYDLLSGMLEVCPEKRIKASVALKHPYFDKGGLTLGNSIRQIPDMQHPLSVKSKAARKQVLKDQQVEPALRRPSRLSERLKNRRQAPSKQ